MKTIITIRGTHCNACTMLIEDACRDIKGIRSCSVNAQTGETRIEHDDTLDLEIVKKEIEALGKYTVELRE